MLELNTCSESDYNILMKHSFIVKQQQREKMQEIYKSSMIKQKEILKREQAEVVMKQQLLSLQLEMVQNELKQAELIKQLEATKE